MTEEHRQKLKRCVLVESVYNALAQVRPMGVPEIVAELRARWQPAWGPVEEVVTVDAVAAARKVLIDNGLCRRDDDKVAVVDARVRVLTDYRRGELTVAKEIPPC